MELLLSGDHSFDKFVRSISSTNKRGLNISLIIGIFFFGPLLLCGAFGDLKKTDLLFLYVVLFVFSLIIYIPLIIVVYIIGWIHITIVFEKYEEIATQKLSEIAENNEKSFNTEASRGILLFRIFNDKINALESLKNALQYKWGDPEVTFLSACHLINRKEYKLASEYLKHVIEEPPNKKALSLSKKLLRKAQSKLS